MARGNGTFSGPDKHWPSCKACMCNDRSNINTPMQFTFISTDLKIPTVTQVLRILKFENQICLGETSCGTQLRRDSNTLQSGESC